MICGERSAEMPLILPSKDGAQVLVAIVSPWERFDASGHETPCVRAQRLGLGEKLGTKSRLRRTSKMRGQSTCGLVVPASSANLLFSPNAGRCVGSAVIIGSGAPPSSDDAQALATIVSPWERFGASGHETPCFRAQRLGLGEIWRNKVPALERVRRTRASYLRFS